MGSTKAVEVKKQQARGGWTPRAWADLLPRWCGYPSARCSSAEPASVSPHENYCSEEDENVHSGVCD